MVMQPKKLAMCVFGPTASGKTGLGIELAKTYNGVIINADSRQIYKKIDIISAMPSAAEFATAEHKLFQVLAPDVRYSVGQYVTDALAAAEAVWIENKIPIFVGGTGLYLKNLIEGINVVPDVAPEIEAALMDEIKANGSTVIHAKLAAVDGASAARIEVNDPQRIVRALGVFLSTGKTLTVWQNVPRAGGLLNMDVDVVRVGILPERAILHGRIKERLGIMQKEGVEAEIRALYEAGLSENLPALTGLGVAELYAYFRGEMSLEEALQATLVATRQYAKRQCTWVKNSYGADILVENAADALPQVENWVKNKP